MPLPSWEVSKEIADGPLGGDGPPDGDLDGGKCPECGYDFKNDELDKNKNRPK
jgi:hypothetical protein